jgi:hypothetical protein
MEEFYDISFQYLRNNKKRLNQPSTTTNKTKEVREKDMKFYKKRILHMTNNLISNIKDSGSKEPNDINCTEIQESFQSYIFNTIQYFKRIDRNEIIQNEINGVVDGGNNTNEPENQPTEKIQEEDDTNFLHQIHNLSKKILQNDRIPTLDKFVKIKKKRYRRNSRNICVNSSSENKISFERF